MDDVKRDRVIVELCFVPGCTGDAATARPGDTLPLEAGLTDQDLEPFLRELASVSVLEFTSTVGLFGGFEDRRRQEQLELRFKVGAALWRCVPEKHPGHIWYNPLFDQWPHRDRHNRLIEGPFAPLLGP